MSETSHLPGGRIETHFHVFGSLAFLAFYLDVRVLMTGTLVVVIDHALRGYLWPQSVYGTVADSDLRFLEHAAWVVFEVVGLLVTVRAAVADKRLAATESIAREAALAGVEQQVADRTAELARSESLFRMLNSHAPGGIITAQHDRSVLDVNMRARDMLAAAQALDGTIDWQSAREAIGSDVADREWARVAAGRIR